MNSNTQILLIILVIIQFFSPRKYSLWALWFTMIFTPAEQCILVGNLNIYCIQIIALVGLLRCLVRGEYRIISYNSIDRLIFCWLLSGAVTYSFLCGMEGVIMKAGRLTEFIPCYWLMRNKILNMKDLVFELNSILGMSLLLFPFVLYEQTTMMNLFSFLGRATTEIRGDRLRCAASFSHPILFGSYAAALIPIIWGIKNITHSFKVYYWICLVINIYFVYASASSGPLLSLLSACIFLSLFRIRYLGRKILYSLCAVSILLQLVMNAPIWYLIARINIVGGSTGWYRAYLIDQTIRHFDEWFLCGIKSVEAWGGVGGGDVTNAYILEGVRGGLLTMILFIAILYCAAKTLVQLSLYVIHKKQQWFLWSLCCSILVNCVTFISVSFFGQMTIFFILFLVIAALAKDYLNKNIYDIGI